MKKKSGAFEETRAEARTETQTKKQTARQPEGRIEACPGDQPAIPSGKRDMDADVLRCLSAFFVVVIHAASASSVTALLFDSFSRFSVPVFVLISGYYLLPRRSPPALCLRRAGGLLFLLLSGSLLYYFYECLAGLRAFHAGELFRYLWTEPVHLWYLCAAAMLSLFTPALSAFCRAASRKEYRYALCLTFLLGSPIFLLFRSGVAPILEAFWERTKTPYLLGLLFLYLAGGYLARFGLPPRRNRIAVYAAGLLGCAATALGTLRLSSGGEREELLLSFFAPGVLLAGLAFFVFVKAFFAMRYPVRSTGPALRLLSDCTLGIYLLHPLCLELFDRWSGAWLGEKPEFLTIPLRAIAAFSAAAVLSFFLRSFRLFLQRQGRRRT